MKNENTNLKSDEAQAKSDLSSLLAEKIGDKTRKEIIMGKLSDAFNEVDNVHFMLRDDNNFEGKSGDIVETIQILMEEIDAIKID